jgi:hypothetical protein
MGGIAPATSLVILNTPRVPLQCLECPTSIRTDLLAHFCFGVASFRIGYTGWIGETTVPVLPDHPCPHSVLNE